MTTDELQRITAALRDEYGLASAIHEAHMAIEDRKRKRVRSVPQQVIVAVVDDRQQWLWDAMDFEMWRSTPTAKRLAEARHAQR